MVVARVASKCRHGAIPALDCDIRGRLSDPLLLSLPMDSYFHVSPDSAREPSAEPLAIMMLLTVLVIFPWYVNLPESIGSWRVTQDWLKWEPKGFDRLVTARDTVLQFFSGSSIIGGPTE
jgi:hypothetical protein